jgi:hypothetical protein
VSVDEYLSPKVKHVFAGKKAKGSRAKSRTAAAAGSGNVKEDGEAEEEEEEESSSEPAPPRKKKRRSKLPLRALQVLRAWFMAHLAHPSVVCAKLASPN